MSSHETVTVRITSAQRPTYWYADMIGEEFDVRQDVIGGDYTLVGDEAERYLHIKSEDCEIVSEQR